MTEKELKKYKYLQPLGNCKSQHDSFSLVWFQYYCVFITRMFVYVCTAIKDAMIFCPGQYIAFEYWFSYSTVGSRF